MNISPYEPDNIYCGDNAKLIKALPDNCIDLTVTSPPYDNLRDYNGYSWDFETLAKELFRVTKTGGVVVWIVGDATINGSETGTSFRQAIRFMEIGFRLHDTMIYKTTKPPENSNRYQPSFEYMFILTKDKIKTFNPIMVKVLNRRTCNSRTFRDKNGKVKKTYHGKMNEYTVKKNVWEINAGYMKSTTDKIAYNHPAIFPEALARDHILSWSNEGDLVFDPFTGSGTTLKMAHECQRKYLGFEISQEYIDIAKQRLKQRQLFSA